MIGRRGGVPSSDPADGSAGGASERDVEPEPRSANPRGGSALGPRGRDLFSRLFGDRRKHKAATREAMTIAIASGKGGTGKSFVSTSLAVLLHQAGRQVALVDCDFGLACDHLLLGVNPRLTLRHLLTGQARLGDIRVTTPCGPVLIPGGSGIRQMANLSDQELATFGRTLGELAATEDVVLLDMGAGISPQTVLTSTSADHVVLVTQPEIAALTDAYAVCKNLTQLKRDASLFVIVNRVTEPGLGQQVFAKLESVMQRFTGLSLHYLGEIGDDPTVTQRRLGQLPIVVTEPESSTARAMAAVLAELTRHVGPFEPRDVGAGEDFESRFRAQRLFL